MESGDRLGNVFSDEESDSFDDIVYNTKAPDEGENDSFDDPVPGMEDLREDDSFDNPVVLPIVEGGGNGVDEGEEGDDCDDEEEEDEEKEEERELNLEEEDFNLLTIEKVPMKVLRARIARVMAEIFGRGEHAAAALFDVANKIVFQSTMLNVGNNPVIDLLIRGLTLVLLDTRPREQSANQAEQILILFITKLAIKNKSMKCGDLLNHLVQLIDSLCFHIESSVRVRVNRLVSCLIEEANKYEDAMREHGDNVFLFTDENPEENEDVIPEGVNKRWLQRLTRTLMDKSPQVRSQAVIALSLYDHITVCKITDGNELTVNDMLWKSMHDVDESVRLTAARRIHIVDEKEIDKCINYIERSKDNRVRQEIIIRLASDVHISSFAEKQRFRLLNILSDSESARIQEVIQQRLVGSWMKVAGEDIVSLSCFPAPNAKHEIPKEFPSLILEYLDPFVDPNAVYVFMKSATRRYIHQISGKQSNESDIEQFMKDCLKMAAIDSESIGLMRRTTFRLVSTDTDPKTDLRRTFLRIFITRCFVDVVFQLSHNRIDSQHLRNRALMFFLPDVTTFVYHLKEFCCAYFKKEERTENNCKELFLYNIIHLINRAVKYGDAGNDKSIYKQALVQILGNADLDFSDDSISTMVTTCFDLCESENEKDELCDWICDTASKLMLHESNEHDEENPSLTNAMENNSVSERMYLRGATMLLSTCEHESIEKPTDSMTELFKRIIPALLGNESQVIKKVGLELIGFATSIDFINCEPYIKLTRYLIERDDEVLKSTGLHTLVRVIKAHEFPKTAMAIFSDDQEDEQSCQEALAKLIEKSLVSLQGAALVQAIQDCLSMISYGRYAWPKLYCAILLIVFQKRNQDYQLVKMLNTFCKRSVKSDYKKANLLNGFVRAVNEISKKNEHDANFNLLEMTEIVCTAISSVPTVEEDGEKVQRRVEKEKYIEVELAHKMISRSESLPSAWFIRHVFTAMATSLELLCIPMKQLNALHDHLEDALTPVRFNAEKTAVIAFKRFKKNCENLLTLHRKMKGMPLTVDLRKVKSEMSDSQEMITTSSSTSSAKKKKNRQEWDDDEVAENSDDSFEYCPKSTRTRKRLITPQLGTPSKKSKAAFKENEEEEDEECI